MRRLPVPGGNTSTAFITNVIPVFEDERVHRFLRRHAPTVLDLIAGVGMRRMIAVVPMTHAFTLAAGAWASVDELARTPPAQRREVLVCACASALRDLDTAFGNYFAHVFPYMDMSIQQDPSLSYYLCNNGLTNMLTVLARAERRKWAYPRQRVLRAIYNYECYQFAKKAVARSSSTDKRKFVDDTLAELLDLDYDRDCVDVGAPFQPTPPFSFTYDEVRVSPHALAPFKRLFRFVEGMVLLPRLLRIVVAHSDKQRKQQKQHTATATAAATASQDKGSSTGNSASDSGDDGDVDVRGVDGSVPALVAAVRSLPLLNDETLKTEFGLENDSAPEADASTNTAATTTTASEEMDVFRAVQLALGLNNPRKDLRVDDENQQMKIPDISTSKAATQYLLDSVVSRLYNQTYTKRVEAKQAAENAEAKQALVDQLLASKTREEFVDLMRNGIVYLDAVKAVIDNSSCDGVDVLLRGLADMALDVPCRLEKIELIVLGIDRTRAEPQSGGDGHGDDGSGDEAGPLIVWNRGNVLRLDLSSLASVYCTAGRAEEWAAIRAEHKARCIHVYREGANRHGHSNDRPSYWALGYKDMDHFKASVSQQEFDEYCAIHTNCCGFASS